MTSSSEMRWSVRPDKIEWVKAHRSEYGGLKAAVEEYDRRWPRREVVKVATPPLSVAECMEILTIHAARHDLHPAQELAFRHAVEVLETWDTFEDTIEDADEPVDLWLPIAGEEEAEAVEKLHSTTDATVWAEEWMKIAKGMADRDGEMTDHDVEGWMIGWFANAIEIGRKAGRDEWYKIEDLDKKED